MDLIDALQALSARLDQQLAHIQTEEATKNALVLPFINALGYNVFDLTEVVPEFNADASMSGLKKGEKVDYVIKRGDEVLMLIECKTAGADLKREHASQLLRYFHVTNARVGVLTNGIWYRFYSDLDEPNKMDRRPFLEVDVSKLDEGAVAELKQLTKAHFNVDELVGKARELKDLRALRNEVAAEFENPSEDLVRLLTGRVNPGSRFTASVRDYYTTLTRKALGQYVSDRVSARLQNAIQAEASGVPAPIAAEKPAEGPADVGRPGVDTTEEEREGFLIVRGILREVVDSQRVVARDVQSYFGILLDDNNRKPICRLHFGTARKFVEVFDIEGGDRVEISDLSGLYGLSDRLKAAASRYGA
jgi:hypothetical protein